MTRITASLDPVVRACFLFRRERDPPVGSSANDQGDIRQARCARIPYGYERITFFSAGFEEATTILAGIAILAAAIHKCIVGLQLENLGMGGLLALAVGVLNATLGYYLLQVGLPHPIAHLARPTTNTS